MRLFLIFLFAFIQTLTPAFAESPLTCPSPESVNKSTNIWPEGFWLPLYKSNSELASEADMKKFKKFAKSFVRAEWSGSFLEAAHCFYKGEGDEQTIFDKIILARDMQKPDSALFPLWKHLAAEQLYYCDSNSENDCPYSDIGR